MRSRCSTSGVDRVSPTISRIVVLRSLQIIIRRGSKLSNEWPKNQIPMGNAASTAECEVNQPHQRTPSNRAASFLLKCTNAITNATDMSTDHKERGNLTLTCCSEWKKRVPKRKIAGRYSIRGRRNNLCERRKNNMKVDISKEMKHNACGDTFPRARTTSTSTTSVP